jgi:hypothetical protein
LSNIHTNANRIQRPPLKFELQCKLNPVHHFGK